MIKKFVSALLLLLYLISCKDSTNSYNIKDEIIVNQIQNDLNKDSIELVIFSNKKLQTKYNWDKWRENLERKTLSNPNLIGYVHLNKYDSIDYNSFDTLSIEFSTNRGYKLNDSCGLFFGNANWKKKIHNQSSASIGNSFDNNYACIKCESGSVNYLYLIYSYSKDNARIYDSIPFKGGNKGFGF